MSYDKEKNEEIKREIIKNNPNIVILDPDAESRFTLNHLEIRNITNKLKKENNG